MGNLFTRSLSNVEKLQEIVEAIDREEKSRVALQEKKNIWEDNLIIYGNIFCFSTGIFLCIQYMYGITQGSYCFFFPAIFSFLFWLTKKIITRIFEVNLNSTNSKICQLKLQKEEIMDVILKNRPLENFDFFRNGGGKPIFSLKSSEESRTSFQKAKMDWSDEMLQPYTRESLLSCKGDTFCSACGRRSL